MQPTNSLPLPSEYAHSYLTYHYLSDTTGVLRRGANWSHFYSG